jgi:Permeases of the drug/metabolite transporter (DMT) superfamily
MKNKTLVYPSIVCAMLCWGFSFIWSNQVLQAGLPVYAMVFLRMSLAGILLFGFMLLCRKLEKVRKADIKWFLLLALAEPFLYFIGEGFGIKLTNSPTLSSVIIATVPIFAMLSAMAIFHERLSRTNITGVLLTLPGIALVVFEGGFGSAENNLGIALLFLAVFSAVAYSLVANKLVHKYSSLTIVTYQHLIGALYFLPFFLTLDLPTVGNMVGSWEILQPMLLLAVLCSCVCYCLFINTIRAIGVSKTSIFTSIIPVITAIAAFAMGHDSMPPIKIIGIGIVVIGLILSQYVRKQKAG